LLIEGRIYDEGSIGTFGFNVFEVPDSDPVVIDPAAGDAPDLVAAELAVSSDGPIYSGGTVTVSWKTRNDGDEPAEGTWADRIIVRNLDTNEVIGNVLVDDEGGMLAAGAERTRQTTIVLPDGNNGVGRISFSLALDVTNAVAEGNTIGSAETNNGASVEVSSQLAPFIDLVVENVQPEPAAGWGPGDTVTLRWTTRNAGTLATESGFSERIVARNTSSGQNFVV